MARHRVNAFSIEAFTRWLRESGCEILEPTNEFERLRYISGRSLGVVYSNTHNDKFTLSGEAISDHAQWRDS